MHLFGGGNPLWVECWNLLSLLWSSATADGVWYVKCRLGGRAIFVLRTSSPPFAFRSFSWAKLCRILHRVTEHDVLWWISFFSPDILVLWEAREKRVCAERGACLLEYPYYFFCILWCYFLVRVVCVCFSSYIILYLSLWPVVVTRDIHTS